MRDPGGLLEPYSTDVLPPKDESARFIAHSRACQVIHVKGDDGFNCFCTETAEFFGDGPKFHPATLHGPTGFLGRDGLTDIDWVAMEDFIAKKLHRCRMNDDPYKPLRDGEIRVLELHPATFDAPFEGELHVVSIDFAYPQRLVGWSERVTQGRHINNAVSLIDKQPVWYTALSYTWGALIFNESIKIGTCRINITSGLAAALRHLRLATQSVFLWIDQICTNQPDTKEKETQVPLMGLIYTRATNTLIWLGEDDFADPQLAVRTLQDVHTRLQLSDATITPEDFERLHIASAMDRSWWSVRHMFRRWWFTRTWTIQETVLSRHCYVQCGTTAFSWDDLAAWSFTLNESTLLNWLITHDDLDAMYSPMVTTDLLMRPIGGTVINQLQQTRLKELTTQRGSANLGTSILLGCLVMARYAAASEPKDKVYGVLGFANVHIKPRYSKHITYRDVFREASITQLLMTGYALPLLSCVDSEEPLLPSWVPDWNTPRVTRDLGYSTKVWGIYMAGGDLYARRTQNIPVTLSEDKKRITIRGKLFDTIMHVGAVTKDPALCIDPANLARNTWASYTELADNSTSIATYSTKSDSVYNAFFQTLMAGRDGTSTAPLTTDHSEVFSLILDSTIGHEPSLLGQTYSVRRKKGHFTLGSLVAKKGAKARKPVQMLEGLRIALKDALHMRRFAVTKKGYFALVPRGAKIGDEVVVFENCCVPFIIRGAYAPDVDGEVFQLVGETYVHGIMKGEAMCMQELPLRDVTLV